MGGKILSLVEKYFNDGTPFGYRDFERVTGIDGKVAAMNLKKLANRHRIGSYNVGGGNYTTTMYCYRTVEEANKSIKNQNEMIDKYELKQKKLKLV